MRDILEMLVVLAIASAIILSAIFAIVWPLNAYQCHSRADKMQLVSDYGPMQGCMVKVGKRWAPLAYIRIVDDEVVIQGGGE